MHPAIGDFIDHGYHTFPRLDAAAAQALLSKIKLSRNYGANLFLSEAEFDADPQYIGVNPRPGRNLLEAYEADLSFVEENPAVVSALTELLGDGYEILLKKLICGVPASVVPDWLKARIHGNPVNNLGAYVRPEYRDVTYFYGIDRTARPTSSPSTSICTTWGRMTRRCSCWRTAIASAAACFRTTSSSPATAGSTATVAAAKSRRGSICSPARPATPPCGTPAPCTALSPTPPTMSG